MFKRRGYFYLITAVAMTAALAASCSNSTQPPPTKHVDQVSVPDNLTVNGGEHFTVPITFENTVPVAGVSIPLVYSTIYGRCDSVSFVDSRLSGFFYKWGFIDTARGIVNFGAVNTSGVESGSGNLATLYFWAYGNAPEGDLTIDASPDTTRGPAYADTSISPILIRPEFKAGKVHVHTIVD